MADNVTSTSPASPPSPPSRLTQLRKAEPWFTTKFCFRLALCIFNIVAIGCTASIIAYNSKSEDLYNNYYNLPRSDVAEGLSRNLYLAILDYDYDNYPWSDYIQLPKGIMVVLCISFAWCIVAMRIPFVLKPTQRVHPGLAVACDLILWLAFLVIGLFTVMALWSLTRFGADPTYLPDRYSTYSYYSYGYSNNGYYYLAPNGTWVYNTTITSVTYSDPTPTDNSTGSTTDYNAGYNAGEVVGYTDGNQAGYTDGYNDYMQDDYNYNYGDEHDYGSHNASLSGGNSTYNQGWRDGYDYGFSDAYSYAYEEGSDAASNALSSGSSTLITTGTWTTLTTTSVQSSSTVIFKRFITTSATQATPTGKDDILVEKRNSDALDHAALPPPTTTKPHLAERSVAARQFGTGVSPTATPTSNSTRSCSDAFASCAEQDDLINQMWRAKPRLVAIVAVINAAQWLNLILHFTLFVWACHDTAVLKRLRKDKRRTQIAEILISDLEKRGLVLTIEGRRALAQASHGLPTDPTAGPSTSFTEPVNHDQDQDQTQIGDQAQNPNRNENQKQKQPEMAQAGPSSQAGWPLPVIKEV